MSKQRLLVVDDDPEIVRLIRAYLEKAGFEVFTAHNGNNALHMLRREKPDLLILDLMLPDKDGWDITRHIRNDDSLHHTPIIMLTARVDDTDKIIGLELGADDYITKPFNPREVVARVRALLRRSSVTGQIVPQVLHTGELRMDIGRREVTLAKELIELTPTEFDILKVFLENPGYAFTRGELISKGMGYEYAGMERTLDSHIKNLRRKINNDCIQTVYGIGYKLTEA
jgi:two-component system alkaline phosphatase synthesis response regulator PhoP